MTEQERVLDFLTRTAEAIALTFGDNCETLIHDMSKPGHPLLAIFHSQGRPVGSTASVDGGGKDDLSSANLPSLSEDAVNTFAVTENGRYVKSTTVHYRGEGYHYALGINFDYTSLLPAVNILQTLTQTDSNLMENVDRQRRMQIDEIFDDCVRSIGTPLLSMKKQEKLILIRMLSERNVFEFQKSVSYVAEKLGVSRYTVYKYMHEVNGD